MEEVVERRVWVAEHRGGGGRLFFSSESSTFVDY